MTKPWEHEPDALDFEAEGLPCAMRRNHHGVWCGYVGVAADHPLFGLPINHPLKLPPEWFASRRGLEGTSALDLFAHALMNGGAIHEACPISIAMQVHGGVNFSDISPPGSDDATGRWWFGFDCGHAGDYLPAFDGFDRTIVAKLPKRMPAPMRLAIERIMADAIYRDRQYVVGECQSLAAQLVAIVAVIQKMRITSGETDGSEAR